MKKEAYVAVAAESAGDGVLSSDAGTLRPHAPSATSVFGLKLLVYTTLSYPREASLPSTSLGSHAKCVYEAFSDECMRP